MLKDLSEIIRTQKSKVRAFTNQNPILSEEFKRRYLETFTNKSSEIYFYDTFSMVKTSKELNIYVPNQWFYLAYLGAPLVKEIVTYRDLIKERADLKSQKEFEVFIKKAREGELDNDIYNRIVRGLSNEEAIYVKKVLTDYEWWGGGRDLARGDFYESSVLNLLNLSNVSSSYVASISLHISKYILHEGISTNTLFTLTEGSKAFSDYETKFKMWIEDTQENVKSNLQYFNTLKRFIKAVNLELAEEDFTPISLWKSPLEFANQYPVEKIMNIAGDLNSNTSFIPKGKNSGSELKTIYSRYLEWVETLKEHQEEEGLVFQDTYNDELKNLHRQYIYVGAPGTGKSFKLNQESELFEGNIERVTFHPSTSYGSFVGVFKPFPKKIVLRDSNGRVVTQADGDILYDEKITYRYVPGPLIKILVEALLHPNTAYLLIIEELNRANVATAFGDLFQLLDRDEDYLSEYPISINEDLENYLDTVYADNANRNLVDNMRRKLEDGLVFPENLYIWATMNSADQGVMPMDTAFKRRWEQRYFGIDDAWLQNGGKKRFSEYEKIKCCVKNSDNETEVKFISWNVLRRIINDILSVETNILEDKLLGPYFISERILTSDSERVTESFRTKVLMYLFDDVVKFNRSILFKNIDKMRYSNVVRAFEEKGLEIFDISEETIAQYESDEF